MSTDLKSAERALNTLANEISERQRRAERAKGALSEKRRELAKLLGVPVKTAPAELLKKARAQTGQLEASVAEELEELKSKIEELEELVG